jgi:thioredoxin reductase
MTGSANYSPVCIIGAGPYGLAIAAHLKFFGVPFRIFGSPMHRWLKQMPRGMNLKSEGCASSLYDPAGNYTLDQYCKTTGDSYSEWGLPVSRDLLARYALSFQQTLVPEVENVLVSAVKKLPGGFELQLNNGEGLKTSNVIIATGLDYMAYVPDEIARLPTELRSHSADHFDFSGFKDKEVVVIGGGQSGLETAAILKEEGASISLVVRAPLLQWHPAPSMAHKSVYNRLRNPRTRMGDGRGLWIYDNLPGLFHHLPQQVRIGIVAGTLGPAGAWWLRDRVVGRLPIFLGQHISGSEKRGTRVALKITDQGGQARDLFADHIISATGYRFNTNNLPFLDKDMRSQLRLEQQSPLLSSNLESSIPGLYFTGPASAYSFGPVMRFLAGAGYAAGRISHHIAREQRLRTPQLARPKKCSDVFS